MVGPVKRTKRKNVLSNQIAVNQADTKEVDRQVFQIKKEVKENHLSDMLQQMHNLEFTECQHLANKNVASCPKNI